MKSRGTDQTIAVRIRITESISIDQREAAFLRTMAQFCVENRMAGSHACKLLDALLRDAGIPEYDGGPVYGLFEEQR